MNKRQTKKIVINNSTRAFINDKRFQCTNFEFYSCIGMSGISQGRDETQKIYCPDPLNYDKFIVSERISGRKQDGTTSIMGYLDRGKSKLADLFNKRCTFDMQVQVGSCGSPFLFEDFEKLIIFKDVEASSYSTDTLLALTSNEVGPIIETAELVFEDAYEVVHKTLFNNTNAIISNGPLISASLFCNKDSCLCPISDNSSYYAQLRENLAGTQAELWVVYTLDGYNWNEIQVTSGGVFNIVQLLNTNSVVSVSGSLITVFYLDNMVNTGLSTISDVIAQSLYVFDNTIYTGLTNIYGVDSYGINLFVVGTNSTVLIQNMQSKIIEQIDTSSLPIEELYTISVHDDFALVGGDNGLLFSIDLKNNSVTQLTSPVSTAITHIKVLNEAAWVLTTIDGNNLKTCDCGLNWSPMDRLFGCVSAIDFFDDIIGYAVTADTNDGVYVHRTIDGGKTWFRLTQQNNAVSYPLTHQINNISICNEPDNIVLSGRVSDTVLTPTQICDPNTQWVSATDTGIIITLIG